MHAKDLKQAADRLLTADIGIEVAQAAAGDLGPGLVVLIRDNLGLVVAVRHEAVDLASVPDSCGTLLSLFTSPEARGPMLVVSLLPDADPADLVAAWPVLRERVKAAGGTAIDWVLATEAGAVSAAGLSVD